MRSASLKVPQSLFTSNGAPETFLPDVGICDSPLCAHAPVAATPPIAVIKVAIAMLTFGFAFISLSSQGAASDAAFGCPLSSRQNLFAAITVHDVLDDLDAEPRPGRRIHPAVDMRERAGDEIMLHGISERLELEQLAGGRIERDGEARGRHDRRRPRVGVGLPAVELAAFGHLLEAGNALRAPRIDADHIDGPSRQHPLELLERPLA